MMESQRFALDSCFSSMENMMNQMIESLQSQSEVQTPMEDVVHDVLNFNDEDHCIVVDILS